MKRNGRRILNFREFQPLKRTVDVAEVGEIVLDRLEDRVCFVVGKVGVGKQDDRSSDGGNIILEEVIGGFGDHGRVGAQFVVDLLLGGGRHAEQVQLQGRSRVDDMA